MFDKRYILGLIYIVLLVSLPLIGIKKSLNVMMSTDIKVPVIAEQQDVATPTTTVIYRS